MYCAKLNTCLFALTVILGSAGSVRADKSDFLVNDDGGTTEQDHPRIAVGANGELAAVWVDRRLGSADIFLQRFSADGTKIGINRRVNENAGTAHQNEVAVAADLNGLYSVVWKDYRNGAYPFDPDIYLQRFDSSLTPLDSNTVLTVELPDSLKETPDIALSQWGGGVVVWADYRNRNWDIYGQLITADGSPVGANFMINNDGGTAQQHAPRVAISPEGWFVVAWYDSRNGHDDIYVQRYNASATRLGTNVRVNSDAGTVRQAFPDVSCDGAGHFSVVWVDWRNGVYPANPDIYARKFDTTMTPLAIETMVNQDGSRRAQREPTIAADRRGNVAIIWSDSSGSARLFDIVGQMIDVDGVIREANFQANTETDSTQLQADVALDGRNRYVIWADKRNGNYDIYASITKYNDPTLVPSPTSLQFEMLVGGDLPAAQQLQIDHIGYNPLNFQVRRSQSWLQVTPSSGVTPATVSVSITTDTLPYGTYFANLTLYDLSNNDSTVQVSVRLDVASPILELSDDTLHFQVFGGVSDIDSRTLQISNAGIGSLNWSVVEALDWLETAPDSGPDDTSITLSVNGLTLSAGSLMDSFTVEAAGAVNSPATVWLAVDVSDGQPFLVLEPDRIVLMSEDPAADTTMTVVRNAGTGALNWSATSSASWLVLDRGTGTDNDTVRFTVDTSGMGPGTYSAAVSFTDPAAYHQLVTLPFVLDYLAPGTDTLIVGDLTLATGESDSLPVQIILHNAAGRIELPLAFDHSLVAINSISLGPDIPDFMTADLSVDTTQEVVSLVISSAQADSLLAESSYLLLWLHMTAGMSTGEFEAAEALASHQAAVVINQSGARLHPTVLPGLIRVQDPTGVEIDQPGDLPEVYSLGQNYPNPFNPATTIDYDIPVASDVKLEVYNILGQRVAQLARGMHSVGAYKVLWDGRLADGRQAPSGIYFYRLRAAGVSLVRKMVLLK